MSSPGGQPCPTAMADDASRRKHKSGGVRSAGPHNGVSQCRRRPAQPATYQTGRCRAGLAAAQLGSWRRPQPWRPSGWRRRTWATQMGTARARLWTAMGRRRRCSWGRSAGAGLLGCVRRRPACVATAAAAPSCTPSPQHYGGYVGAQGPRAAGGGAECRRAARAGAGQRPAWGGGSGCGRGQRRERQRQGGHRAAVPRGVGLQRRWVAQRRCVRCSRHSQGHRRMLCRLASSSCSSRIASSGAPCCSPTLSTSQAAARPALTAAQQPWAHPTQPLPLAV